MMTNFFKILFQLIEIKEVFHAKVQSVAKTCREATAFVSCLYYLISIMLLSKVIR